MYMQLVNYCMQKLDMLVPGVTVDQYIIKEIMMYIAVALIVPANDSSVTSENFGLWVNHSYLCPSSYYYWLIISGSC